MALHVALACAGLVLLYLGAEWLVRGASRLAAARGVSPIVIGLTVVAFGTSLPELFGSAFATLRGQSDIAIGNVIGSNIFNVGFILGIGALLRPLRIERQLIRLEIPLLTLVSAALFLLLLDLEISRVEGGLLLAAFAGYLAFLVRVGGRERMNGTPTSPDAGRGGEWMSVVLVLAGLGTLLFGASLLVDAAVVLARGIGVSELVIGLTLVAAGTSLPELATSVVAALRREVDIAVGNIVGSNLFNILAILGTASLVRPIETTGHVLRLDLPAMLVLALLLLPIARTGFRIQRLEGAALLASYGLYLALIIGRGMEG